MKKLNFYSRGCALYCYEQRHKDSALFRFMQVFEAQILHYCHPMTPTATRTKSR